MTAKEKLVQLLAIWLAVYPAVLCMSYIFRWFDVTWPLWLQLMLSTAITVPLISFVAVPKVRVAMARAQGTSPAELARREAEKAELKEDAQARGE